MKIIVSFLLFFVLGFSYSAKSQEMTDAVGLWMNEAQDEIVEFFFCEDTLCGKIYWLKDRNEFLDSKNPDFAFQNQPLCGLDMMWGFDRSSKNVWTKGAHYNHNTGQTRHTNIMISDENPDSMVLHSFPNKAMAYDPTGMLGKKQVWTKVASDDYPRCDPKFQSRSFDALESLKQ